MAGLLEAVQNVVLRVPDQPLDLLEIQRAALQGLADAAGADADFDEVPNDLRELSLSESHSRHPVARSLRRECPAADHIRCRRFRCAEKSPALVGVASPGTLAIFLTGDRGPEPRPGVPSPAEPREGPVPAAGDPHPPRRKA